ncbi:MAG: GIY-YIG nuclease family protein [Chitinophagaceae bacterium]|nr:GIY-YIG nuclease family protein [Chitinophagaceae bacterium]
MQKVTGSTPVTSTSPVKSGLFLWILFFYIIYSSTLDKFYVGYSSNLEKRLLEHENRQLELD